MSGLGIAALTSTITVSLVSGILWFLRDLLFEGLKAKIQAGFDEKLEKLKADLRREHEEALAVLQKDLVVLREKELSGHSEKLKSYKLVIDVLAEIYADIAIAMSAEDIGSVTDKYNRHWIRCYGYLSMLAPQDVMDAFDPVNDYVLQLLSDRTQAQPWSESRKLALTLLNAIRRDIGLDTSEIEYRGNL